MDSLPPVDLVWAQTLGGEACIGEHELALKLSAALGRPASAVAGGVGQGGPLVRGSIGRASTGQGWAAVVEVRRGDLPPLRRELGLLADDCRELDEAVVLVAALLVDSEVSKPPRLTIERAAPPLSVAVGPDVAAAAGMLPGVSFGFGLITEAELGRGFWPLTLSALEWTISRVTSGGSGGRIGAWTLGLGVCPLAWAAEPWAVFACAGASAGQVHSSGVGLDRPNDNVRALVQVEVQVGLRLRLATHLALRVGLTGGVPIVRDTYAFSESDGTVQDVFRTASVVPMGQLAVELRSPR